MKTKYLLPIALMLLGGCDSYPLPSGQGASEASVASAASAAVEQASEVQKPTLHPLPEDAIYQGPDEPPMLTDEQLAAYKRDGFVDIEGNAYPVMSAAYYNKLAREENLNGGEEWKAGDSGTYGSSQCNMQYMASAINCLDKEAVRMWWNSQVSWLNTCANLTAETNWLGGKMLEQSAQRCLNRLATDNGWGNFREMQTALSRKGFNVVSPAERAAAERARAEQARRDNPCMDAVIENVGAAQQCFDRNQVAHWWSFAEQDIAGCIEGGLRFEASQQHGGSMAAAFEGSGEAVKRQCESEVAEKAKFNSRGAMIAYLNEKGVRRQDTLRAFRQEWIRTYGSME